MRLYAQGPAVTRLSHDKHGNVRLIHTHEAIPPAGPQRLKKAQAATGYQLPAAERAHRNRVQKIARKSRKRGR